MKLVLILLLAMVLISCDNIPHKCSLDNSILAKNDSILRISKYKARFNLTLEKFKEPELEKLHNKSYRLIVTYPCEREKWIYRFERTEEGQSLVKFARISNPWSLTANGKIVLRNFQSNF